MDALQTHTTLEHAKKIEVAVAADTSDLALAHATLQAKHKDTLLQLARLQNSKSTITYQIDNLKDRYN